MAAVILEVPFVYKATIIRPRHRNPEHVRLIGRLPVKVRAVTDTEAPVAARAHVRRSWRSVYGSGATDGPTDLPFEYRVLAGRLMKPLHLDLGRERDEWEPVRRGEAQAVLDLWQARALAARAGAAPVTRALVSDWMVPAWSHHEPPFFDERLLEHREWLADDRAAREALVREALEFGSAFVDGILHVPTKGPVLVAKVASPSAYGAAPRHAAVEVEPEGGQIHLAAAAKAFRADRLAEAEAAAMRLAHEAGVDMSVRHLGRLEVLYPAAFTEDDTARALHSACAAALQSVRNCILTMPTAAIRCYADLVDAVEASDGTPGGLEFDTLLMLATDVRDRDVRAHPYLRDHAVWHPVSKFERRLEAARVAMPMHDHDTAARAAGPRR